MLITYIIYLSKITFSYNSITLYQI